MKSNIKVVWTKYGYQKRTFGRTNRRIGADTRRITWKKFGEHHGSQWYSKGHRKYWKRALHQAMRRAWNKYSRQFEGLSCESAKELGLDVSIKDSIVRAARSRVNWRND